MSNLAEVQRTIQQGESAPRPPDPPFVATLRAIDRAFARVEGFVVSIILAVLILVGVYGAVRRNLWKPSPFWVDEVVRYCVFFIGLVSAALAAQSERLFNIDMFTKLLGARGKLVVRIGWAAFTIYVCTLFVSSSLTLRALTLLGEEGEVLDPKWGVLSLPIGLGLIAVHMALHILIDVYYLATGQIPPELAAPQVPKA